MSQSIKVAYFIAYKAISKGNKAVLCFIITMLVLVFLNLILIPSLLEGLIDNVNGKQVDMLMSNVIVSSENGVITNAEEQMNRINSVDGVIASAPHNTVGAEIRFNNRRGTWGITSIDPKRELDVFSIKNTLVAGENLEENDTDKILLGMQVAGMEKKDLELYTASLQTFYVGNPVTVVFSNGFEKIFTVKGIFYTEHIQADTKSFITQRALDEVFPEMTDTAMSIHIKTRDDAVQQSIEEAVKNSGQELKVENWKDTAGLVKSMTESFSTIKVIVRVLAFLVGGLTVFIITYIELFSKRKQIGIERAIGITEGAIITSYTFRAIFYSFLGSLIASLLFVFILVPLERQFPLKFPFGYVYLVTNLYELFGYGLILIAIAVISALLPAFRSTHIKIIDAIWGS